MPSLWSAHNFRGLRYAPLVRQLQVLSARPWPPRLVHARAVRLLLEAAKRLRPSEQDETPFPHPLVATFLLTGGRSAEILGLEVEDISFDRELVTFRPNEWRRFKTGTSHRAVPLWPQLAEVLKDHVFAAAAPPGRLLFPSLRTGREAMLTDIRKMLDRVAKSAGWERGEIRTKMFRHTYCAARLQTIDNGHPCRRIRLPGNWGTVGSRWFVECMAILAMFGTALRSSNTVQSSTASGLVSASRPSIVATIVTTPLQPTNRNKATSELTHCRRRTYKECARQDSNLRPLAPEANALSS